MTEKLKTLLHQRAENIDFAAPDIEAMTRAGDRRRRTRRTLVGGVAAVAVVGALAATQMGSGSSPDGLGVANDPGSPAVLTWATGSIVHEGDRTTDLGHPVDAFVRTAAGYVFASDGDVYETRSTGVQKVGQIDRKHPQLVSDPEGTLAGWVQRGTDQYVVQDVASDVTSVEQKAPRTNDTSMPRFMAIDGTTAYWQEADGLAAHDLSTGESTALDPGASDQKWLIDVQDGVFAVYDKGVRIGSSYTDTRPISDQMSSGGVLSPNGKYYAPDDELLTVVEGATGRDVTPALDGYFFSTGYEWLNADTLAVIALKDSEKDPITLLSCTISTSGCTVVAEAAGTYPDVQLPVGASLGD